MFKSKNGCLKIQFCLQLIPSLFVLKSDTGYLKIQSCYYRIPGLLILKSGSKFIKIHVCKILHPNLDWHISSMVFRNFQVWINIKSKQETKPGKIAFLPGLDYSRNPNKKEVKSN